MFIILPLLTFVIGFLVLLGVQSRRGDRLAGVRSVFLQTAAFMGGYLLLSTELLSLFKLLAQPWAAVCWGLAVVVTGWFGWQKGLLAEGVRSLRARWQRPDAFGLAAGALLAIILVLLFLVAVIAPPNNDDSLQYHMSRVAHWAQDRSLGFYATGFEPQLYVPIWAETAILNVRLLWGDDKLANLVQWGSLAGILVAVSALAKLLGAGRKGQWAAAAFALSIPMALLQATSTQNDLVTAFWLVSLLYFILLSAKRELFLEELLGLSFTFGLGLVTKASFYPYCFLPMLFFIILQFKRHKPGRVILNGLLVGAVALVLNLGYWERNLATFGNPLGPASVVEGQSIFKFNPGVLAGNLVGNFARNFVTPRESLNAAIVARLQSAFRPIDPQMSTFNLVWGWNHEDFAGSPLHLALMPVTLLLLVVFRRRLDGRLIWPYTLVAGGLFIMLPIVISSGGDFLRYELPFVVAWAALFGIAVEGIGAKWLQPVVVVLLLVAAMPWVLFNRTRPLIAMRPNSKDPFTIPCLASCTTGSVLNELPVRTLFAGNIVLEGPYTLATDAIRASGCRSVGLQLDSHDLEYTFWWLLDAPQSGIRLETIYTYPELERFVDPAFKPCAILCTICRSDTRMITHLHGLDLISDWTGKVQLYMGNNYDPDPDK